MPKASKFRDMAVSMAQTANRDHLTPVITIPNRGLYYRAVRIGFMRFHKRSMSNRYFYSLRYRLKCFPGTVSYYVLCLS